MPPSQRYRPTTMDERTFDWIPPVDEARAGNAPFRLQTLIRTDRAPRSQQWTRRMWLDQGREGACTGFGAAHVLSMSPEAKVMTNAHGQRFYKGAQRYDEWPGENYEGSSVWGVMKYLNKETGFVGAYWWAETLAEMVHAVGYYGPVEMGCNWYSGMMNTHADGYVKAQGSVVGGHAFALGGVDIRENCFRLDNSWGPGWGARGSAKLSFADAEKLLAAQGEVALPRKTRATAAARAA
jgi:hypothetical protein